MGASLIITGARAASAGSIIKGLHRMVYHEIKIGDNLSIMSEMAEASVDLIYADPPFNTGRDFGDYDDRWESGEDYIEFLRLRVIEMRRLLKPTGSIYLHCDHNMSHYIKVMMDEVFGKRQFRREIAWKRASGGKGMVKRNYSNLIDVILFYSKTDRYWFKQTYTPLTEDQAKRYRFDDHDGKGKYTLDTLHAATQTSGHVFEYKGYASPRTGWRHKIEKMEALEAEGLLWFPKDTSKQIRFKRHLDGSKGIPLGNLWLDIVNVAGSDSQFIGYQTQKPKALLHRIIQTSCPDDGLVLDPFVGSGTTVEAAYDLRRSAVGIDINPDTPAIKRIAGLPRQLI